MIITLLFQFIFDDGWMEVINPVQMFILELFIHLQSPFLSHFKVSLQVHFPPSIALSYRNYRRRVLPNDSLRRPPLSVVVMLLSHSGEYPCECTNLIFAANSPKTIRLARIITETSEALQMVTNACKFLTNLCEFLTKFTIT